MLLTIKGHPTRKQDGLNIAMFTLYLYSGALKMKTQILHSFKKFSSLAAIMFLFVLAFQNCQKQVEFSKDYASESLAVTSESEDGMTYTNQKIVNLKIQGGSDHFDQMRASTIKDMDSAKVPWTTREENINADLGAEFASDGSKDGIKTVYVELRDKATDVRSNTQVSVFLDTQAPVLSATGLMAMGLQGAQISKGQPTSLAWIGKDKPSVSGVASGFHPSQGLRYGVNYNGDCSESSQSSISPWQVYKDGTSAAWPEEDPLKAFYFCIYGRDRAGNIASLLSQPMTGIWQVIAGDNNQGNGGSALAKSVRFGYPGRIKIDSKNNIYILDVFMNVIRKIDTKGDISLFAGNGVNATMVEGNAMNTPLQAVEMAFDSLDRMYLIGSSAIWRITQSNTPGQNAIISKWITNASGNMRINIDRKTDIIYLSRYTTSQKIESESYIYKFPIKDIDTKFSGLSRPTLSEITSKYIYAGNGKGLSSSTNFTSPAVVPADTSVDYPTALAPGDKGELYYSDVSDGSAYPFGHQQLRVLKKDKNGILQNHLVTTSVSWVNSIEFVHSTDDKGVDQRYLLVATDTNGIKKIALGDTLPVPDSSVTQIDPYPAKDTLRPVRVGGVAAIYDNLSTAKKLSRIIFSESNNSRLTVIDPAGALLVNYGRPVYDQNDTRAIDAMVNNPDSVIQSKNGDIYFSEPLSGVIRKVDNEGKISLVTGKAGSNASISDLSIGLDAFTYSGLSMTYGGRYSMSYNSTSDEIYFSEGYTSKMWSLNLNKKTAQQIAPMRSRTSHPDSWAAFATLVTATPTEKKLLVYRSNPYYPNNGVAIQAYEPTTGASSTIVGNKSVGNPTIGAKALETSLPLAVNAMVMDSSMNIYFSGSSGVFKVDANTGIISQLVTRSFSGLQVVEDGKTLHLIGISGVSLYDIKIENGKTAVLTQLCFPGSTLNRGIQLAQSTDGNLLVADSRNDRIIKYFIRDRHARLTLLDQSCKK